MWSSDTHPLSLRLRLLLFLFVGLGLLLLGLFFLLDRGLDRQIYGRLDEGLRARAHAIAVLLETRPTAEALAELEAMRPEYDVGGHTDFLQIWDARGKTLLVSASNHEGRLRQPPSVPANAPVFYDLDLPDGHRGRAIAQRVSLNGHSADAVLAVAEEREQVDALERQVHIALVSGIVLTSLVAVLLAILAVRSGLRPLLAFGEAVRHGAETADLEPARLPRELRPLAEVLKDAFGGLRRALERERRFARDAAHELRTPLAEIRSSVELASRVPQAAQDLRGSLDSIERMRRSIDGLLALSRYESGMQKVEHEPADLVRCVQRSLALAETTASSRQVRIRCQTPVECWVLTDTDLLERVLDNLVLNAVTHAPEGAAVVLAFDRVDATCRVRLGNPAPELTHEDLEHLGERFWRKSPAREVSEHGGLGLALARSLAQLLGIGLVFRMHEGWLWVELDGLRTLDTEA